MNLSAPIAITVSLLGLCVCSVAWAQADEPAEAPASPSGHRGQEYAAVVGAYRPVDVRGSVSAPIRPKKRHHPSKKKPSTERLGLRATSQAGLDLYLNIRDDTRVRVGQRFAVYRRIRTPIKYASRVRIKVGELEIVRLDNGIAVARVTSGPDEGAEPYLVTPGVLIGDFITPGSPLEDPAAIEAAKKKERAKVAKARLTKTRAKKRCGPKCRAKTLLDEPEPVVPGSPDMDAFVHWDEHPIDF